MTLREFQLDDCGSQTAAPKATAVQSKGFLASPFFTSPKQWRHFSIISSFCKILNRIISHKSGWLMLHVTWGCFFCPLLAWIWGYILKWHHDGKWQQDSKEKSWPRGANKYNMLSCFHGRIHDHEFGHVHPSNPWDWYYIWLFFMVHGGKYAIHGCYGSWCSGTKWHRQN